MNPDPHQDFFLDPHPHFFDADRQHWMGVEKRRVARGEKISFSEEGRGINIVFGLKYRPLDKSAEKRGGSGFERNNIGPDPRGPKCF
jgi:hypothetical protein